MFTVPYENKHRLCTRNTQLKKTEQLLNYIVKRHIENNLCENNVLDVVFVNNSLLEVNQLYTRMNKKFMDHEFVIDTLSSNDDEGNYKSYTSYLLDLMRPDISKNILIACSHKKRINDVIAILNYISKISSFRYQIHITFDEADKNLSLIRGFLKNTKKFIESPLISGVLYVTATPLDNFWNMLNKEGILSLTNMNKNYSQYIADHENYRSIIDHEIIYQEITDNISSPLDYIITAFYNNYIDESDRVVVFAPGEVLKESHDDIKGFFLGKGYAVFVLNSSNKGFFYPDGRGFEDIEEFKEKYNIDGELRDVLKKWYEINTLNLAITGRLNLERGITFNTEGFNFTHAIIFPILKQNDEIQMMGRCCGDKQHIQKMKIICTENTFERTKKYHERMSSDICSQSIECFNSSDFNMSSDSSIPVKITIIDIELLEIIKEKINIPKLYVHHRNEVHNLLVNGIENEKIILEDRNNTRKFSITTRKLASVRKFKEGNNKDANRIKRFNVAFERQRQTSQAGNKDTYSIDFAYDDLNDGVFTNKSSVAWITFRN